MKTPLRVLGFIWLLPATILVWTFYVLPAWALGWIVYETSPAFLVAMFLVAKHKKESWYTKAWREWAGWSGPCVLILKEAPTYDDWYRRTLIHELRHCSQQFIFGPLHYPLYLLASAYVWVFQRDRNAYLDNPFERDARREAGQPVDISKEKWPDGPKDRWPWWVWILLVLSPSLRMLISNPPC